eukprot:m.461543 g.461543  ORF g.461543 m.461543 type:complete len:781 (+) comp20347_c2_seq11:70-2412(+)
MRALVAVVAACLIATVCCTMEPAIEADGDSLNIMAKNVTICQADVSTETCLPGTVVGLFDFFQKFVDLQARVDELEGKVATNADSLETRMDSVEGKVSDNADSLETRMDLAEGRISGNSDSLDSRVGDLEDKVSDNADSLESRVDALEGKVTDDGDSLDTRVGDLEGKVTTNTDSVINRLTDVEADASSLDTRVSGLEGKVTTNDDSLETRVALVEQCGTSTEFSDGSACVSVPGIAPATENDPDCDADTTGRMRIMPDTSLAVCDGTAENVFYPDPPGSVYNPAANCGEIQAAGLPNGHFWIGDGTAATTAHCEDGDLVFDPLFHELGKPILYMPLDGNVRDDLSHVSRTTVHGTEEYQAGIVGQGLKFDDTTYVTLKDLAPWSGPFTTSCWVLMPNLDNGFYPIFGHGQATTEKGLHIAVRYGKPYIGFYSADEGAKGNDLDGLKWNHVVFTSDGGTRKGIYINGRLNVEEIQGFNYQGAGADSELGRLNWRTYETFNGVMDDVAVWDRELTTQEIARLYTHYVDYLGMTNTDCASNPDLANNLIEFDGTQVLCHAGRALPAPYAYFPFDRSTADVYFGRNPAANGNMKYEDSWHGVGFGKSLRFEDSQYLAWDGNQFPDSFWQNAYSVAMWVKFTSVGGSDQNVIGHGAWRTTNGALHITERGGKLHYGMYSNDFTADYDIVAGTWYHVVWQYEPECAECGNDRAAVRVFVNGALAGADTALDLYIGTGANTEVGRNPGSTNNILNGNLDELLFFALALTAEQVADLYAGYEDLITE